MQVFRAEQRVAGMTVGALIERLKRLDRDCLVLIESGEGGLACVRSVSPIPVVFDVNRDPAFGPHEHSGSRDDADAWAVSLVCRPTGTGVA